MISEYFRYLSRSSHDSEYKFFKCFKFRAGIAVIIGYNEGKSLSTFRLYNKSYRIVQFEKNPFEERRIKAMSWIAGKGFAYHMVKLSSEQRAETLFVPRVGGKRQAGQATFQETSPAASETASSNELWGSDRADSADSNDGESAAEASDDGIDQIVVETRIFDTFNLNPDVVIVNEDEFGMGVLDGMSRSISNSQPIFMLPNVWPAMFDAHEFLVGKNYLPYLFNPKKNTLRPLKSTTDNKNVFFVHKGAFETDKEVKM